MDNKESEESLCLSCRFKSVIRGRSQFLVKYNSSFCETYTTVLTVTTSTPTIDHKNKTRVL